MSYKYQVRHKAYCLFIVEIYERSIKNAALLLASLLTTCSVPDVQQPSSVRLLAKWRMVLVYFTRVPWEKLKSYYCFFTYSLFIFSFIKF